MVVRLLKYAHSSRVACPDVQKTLKVTYVPKGFRQHRDPGQCLHGRLERPLGVKCTNKGSALRQRVLTREIHPLDPQPHRYCMLASTASAHRVTRCSLGLYWSRDLCSKHALAGWGMSSFLGQIVRGSEI